MPVPNSNNNPTSNSGSNSDDVEKRATERLADRIQRSRDTAAATRSSAAAGTTASQQNHKSHSRSRFAAADDDLEDDAESSDPLFSNSSSTKQKPTSAESARRELLDRARQRPLTTGVAIPADGDDDRTDDPFAQRPRRGGGAAAGGRGDPTDSYQSTTAADITNKLTKALRINSATNDDGENAMSALTRQRETISHSLGSVGDTNATLREGQKLLKIMKNAVLRERVIKVGVIATLVGIICLIVYLKWIRR